MNTKTNKILVATDLKETSRAALVAALRLARQSGAQVEVLHVLPLPELAQSWRSGLGPQELDALPHAMAVAEQNAQRALRAALEVAASTSGFSGTVRSVVRWGMPGDIIADEVSTEEADLVVMGGHEGSDSATAERVMHATGRAVLIAPTPDVPVPPTPVVESLTGGQRFN